jgi:hypothetical protein
VKGPGLKYRCIAIGVSAGGMDALSSIIPTLPPAFPIPVVVIQHVSPHSDNYMTRLLDNITAIKVKEVDEKEKLKPGVVYTAPPTIMSWWKTILPSPFPWKNGLILPVPPSMCFFNLPPMFTGLTWWGLF